MSDSKSVTMPPHLWEALETMSSEMGVDTNGLVAQAVFTLARLNGYVVPGRPAARDEGTGASPVHVPAAKSTAAPVAVPRPGPASRPAEKRRPEPEPEPEPESEPEDNPFDQQEPGGNDDYLPPENEEYPEPEPEPAPAPRGGGKAALTLIVAGRDPYKMSTDSFTIGRGKTCDFVIESNRVSREHVRILREGGEFVLEDLNSSNGTFFGPNKEKISKRKIKDGDEFTLGTEKIKFQIRK
jgi:FHA domain